MIGFKYKNLIISALSPVPFLIGLSPALADGTYNFINNSGLNATSDKAGYTDALKNLSPSNASSQIISIILMFLGVIFIGLMIYGGISWMTAEGNEQKVEKAKNIIVAAIVGLIVVLAAYAASYFIVSYFSGQTLQ